MRSLQLNVNYPNSRFNITVNTETVGKCRKRRLL